MLLGQRDQPVQTFTPNRSDYPFTNRIRLRAPGWRCQHTEAERLDRFIQTFRKDAVAVMNQVTVSVLEANHFPQLLQGPCGTRVRGDIDACKASTTVLDDHEDVEHSEGRGDRNQGADASASAYRE